MKDELNGVKNVDLPVPENKTGYDRDLARSWVERDPDARFRMLKRKIVENVHLVDFPDFRQAVETVATRANETIGQSPYAVLFDYKDHASRLWVYRLAEAQLQTKPTAETYISGKTEPQFDFPVFKPLYDQGVRDFVVFDDAAYSGEQIINSTIVPLLKFFEKYDKKGECRIVLAVPYVTNTFLASVRSLVDGKKLVLLYREVMPELGEILTPADWDLTKEREGRLDAQSQDKTSPLAITVEEDVLTGATLTWFSHKVADSHSFPSAVRRALKLGTTTPYKKQDTNYFRQEEQFFRTFYTELQKRRQAYRQGSAI